MDACLCRGYVDPASGEVRRTRDPLGTDSLQPGDHAIVGGVDWTFNSGGQGGPSGKELTHTETRDAHATAQYNDSDGVWCAEATDRASEDGGYVGSESGHDTAEDAMWEAASHTRNREPAPRALRPARAARPTSSTWYSRPPTRPARTARPSASATRTATTSPCTSPAAASPPLDRHGTAMVAYRACRA